MQPLAVADPPLASPAAPAAALPEPELPAKKLPLALQQLMDYNKKGLL